MRFTLPKFTNRPLVAKKPIGATTVKYDSCGESWHVLSSSYWTAGIALLHTIRKEGYTSGFLLPPAIFLFRHAVELSLKGLLKDVVSFESGVLTKKETEILKEHKLEALWQAVDARFRDIPGHSRDAWWNRAADIVRQLHNLDPASLEFRYPESRDGSKPTSAGQRLCIDVVQFEQVLHELQVILDGAPAWLDDLRDGNPE
jgi:hypothetical protein